MKKALISGLVAASLLSISVAHAETQHPFAIAPKIGTLGLGLEGTVQLLPNLNARVGLNKYNYSLQRTVSDVSYDANLDLKSVDAMVDWHPFNGAFRVTGGLFNNRNELQLDTTPGQDVTINGTTYSAAQIGTLHGDVSFRKTAPYLGIGFGNAVGANHRLSFNTDIGVLFQGSPAVALTSTGACSTNAQCAVDLEAQRQKSQEDLKNFKYYPVLSAALAYKF